MISIQVIRKKVKMTQMAIATVLVQTLSLPGSPRFGTIYLRILCGCTLSAPEITANSDMDILAGRKGPRLMRFCDEENSPVSIVQVACGPKHALALTNSGTVFSWGNNENFELGRITSSSGASSNPGPSEDDGVEAKCWLPAKVDDALIHPRVKFSKVAAGGSYSLALTQTGQIYAWGTFINEAEKMFYVYKDLCRILQDKPILLREFEGIIDIACGEKHAVAIDNQCQIWTWGWGTNHRLGRPLACVTDLVDTFIPAIVRSACLARSVAAGYGHTLVLDKDGHLWAVSGGRHHSALVSVQGAHFAMGFRKNGRLGVPSQATGSSLPTSSCRKVCMSSGVGASYQLGSRSVEDRDTPQDVILEDGELGPSDSQDARGEDAFCWAGGGETYSVIAATEKPARILPPEKPQVTAASASEATDTLWSLPPSSSNYSQDSSPTPNLRQPEFIHRTRLRDSSLCSLFSCFGLWRRDQRLED
ncbi:unnamed protein product [Parascedosporium putredinis]|uniref:Uncharacterized protein n=1 Tax=Parascedosporium putredinis TaxID=1442378 RepID=A0A9P1HA19_9PEZI|nr:unnamed protein product [Parascedosporium putredinis]CAI8000962.1 unnamed protein product [Parascedosporium putredinis]